MNKIGELATNSCTQLIYAGETIQRGTLVVGETASRIMYDIYSLEGFEKWSKALIANLKLLSHIPAIKGVFTDCLKTLEAQKDLYYATMFIGSTAEMIRNERGERRDLEKWCYFFGNIFEAGKFLQKQQVYAFPRCTDLANRIGSVKVSSEVRLDQIPVIQTMFYHLKDIFIFLASGYNIYKACLQAYRERSFEPLTGTGNVCRLGGNLGKMALITLGHSYHKKWWFSLIDVATQDLSLIGFIWKREMERIQRFRNPPR